jgi:hypothetical protein
VNKPISREAWKFQKRAVSATAALFSPPSGLKDRSMNGLSRLSIEGEISLPNSWPGYGCDILSTRLELDFARGHAHFK